MSYDSSKLSKIPKIKGEMAKAQWHQPVYKGKCASASDPTTKCDHMEVPHLMPATIVFVHGVNSQGEWYHDAAKQFAEGLNTRMGRSDLDTSRLDYDYQKKRIKRRDKDDSRFLSPVIPFYWGVKLNDQDAKTYEGIFLEDNNSWGGGPFQNGTSCLLEFWNQEGFNSTMKIPGLRLPILPLGAVNPSKDRPISQAPPRNYYIHAAQRLAYLLDTIREDFPNEALNLVVHSQGNMIGMLAILYMKQRAPDTVLLNNPPYAFDVSSTLKINAMFGTVEGIKGMQSKQARINTFKAVCDKVQKAKDDFKEDDPRTDNPYPLTTLEIPWICLAPKGVDEYWRHHIGCGYVTDDKKHWYQDPQCSRDNRGKVFLYFNPHDRVIGVIGGIGWQGVSSMAILGQLPNFYQRICARNMGKEGVDGRYVPKVGEKQNYWFDFYAPKGMSADELPKKHQERRQAVAEWERQQPNWSGVRIRVPPKNRNDPPVPGISAGQSCWADTATMYDGQAFWRPKADAAVLGLIDMQQTLVCKAVDYASHDPVTGIFSEGQLLDMEESARVWVNAPTVPKPVALPDSFDLTSGRMDGTDGHGQVVDAEQSEDYHFITQKYMKRLGMLDQYRGGGKEREPIPVEDILAPYAAFDTPATDHSTVLRHGSKRGSEDEKIVANIHSYDLTVGLNYAFFDEKYWDYLLDLADWKISDPYYDTGDLPAASDYPHPPGLDTGRVSAAEQAAAEQKVAAFMQQTPSYTAMNAQVMLTGTGDGTTQEEEAAQRQTA